MAGRAVRAQSRWAERDSREGAARQGRVQTAGESKRANRAPRPNGCRVRAAKLTAQLAGAQQGVVTRKQLLATGTSATTINRWAAEGILHRLHRGVYAVGHLALAPHGAEMAALLACGQYAVLSHWSAAALWSLIDGSPGTVGVTVVHGNPRPKQGLAIHRRRLDKADLRTRHGLPITSPARTLIDLAAEATPGELERLVAEARVKRLLRPGELQKALERNAGRAGTRRLRALLDAEGDAGITRSEAERILGRLLGEARLPQPRTNARVDVAGTSYEVDFLWPGQKVVIEIDSWRFHGHRRAFERDRRKGLALQSAGYEVIRVSALQLTQEPLAVIAQVARALDRAARDRG